MFWVAVLTILLETPILFAAGYRTRRFVAACVLVNLASNLALNLGLSFTGQWYWYALVPAEILVVFLEWAVFTLVADPTDRLRLGSRASRRLLGFTALANLASCLVGCAIFLIR